MNVTSIQLCSLTIDDERTTHLTFPLKNVGRNNPYVLKSATGLDAEDIVTTFNDGPKFFRVQPLDRVINFSIKLNPDYVGGYTLGDLRDYIYRMISGNQQAETWNDESKIDIRFMNGDTYIASLFGFIRRVEHDPFSKSSELILTIECPFPLIRSVEDLPFDIDNDATGTHDYNEVTYNVESRITINDSNSTAPHGFKMQIEVLDTETYCIIWDSRNPTIYLFWLSYTSFEAGDMIYFSSEEDDMYVYLVRDDEIISLMDSFFWGSIWPHMRPGENTFELSENMEVVEATFKETYWGI